MRDTAVVYLCSFICFSFLTACSMPYKHSAVEPSDSTFIGIETLLEAKDTVVLVTIHGMCHHDVEWFKESCDRIATSSGMTVGPVLPVGDSTETGAMLYRSDLFRAGHLLRMYGIVYSDFFLQEKQKTLCRDVKNATKVCPESMLTYNRQRASFNNGLKNQLINDCFADAVAYIGPSGDLVREGVRKALFAIIRDIRMYETLSKAPIVFLSESLGSKVLGDSLLCVPKDALSDILPDLDRTTHLFLGANQIPLLNLGYRGERCEIESALEGLEKSGAPLYSISKKRGGIAGFLDILEAARVIKKGKVKLPRKGLDDRVVVAFTDPNDLLSYEVTPYDIGGRPVVNILVSNDFTYLRWIENPLKAHTGYRENPSVIEWLRCGRDADGNPTCP